MKPVAYPIVCCGRKFWTWDSYDRHIQRTHKGIRPTSVHVQSSLSTESGGEA